jgi:outer membrane protein assembly factor BamA
VKGLIQLLAAAAVLWAQALPVARLEVRGAERIEEGEIIRAAGLTVGQEAGKSEVTAAAERLMATGWFERVNFRLEPGPDGLTVRFIVVERAPEEAEAAPAAPRPRIRTVTFTGTTETPAGRLWAALRGVAEGREYEEEDFRHILESLLRPVFAERGVWQVRFGAIEVRGEDPVDVTVAVDEGPALKLGGVTLEGGEAWMVDEARFPVGLTANRRRIEEAMIRLRQRLARDGYLRPAFTQTERVEDSEVRLELHLERGVQYRFGALRIRGLDAEAEQRARRLWTVPEGGVANPEAVETWIRAVFDARIAKGTGVRREYVHHDDAPVVDVEVEFR